MPNPGDDKKLQLLRVTRSVFIHPSNLARLTHSKMKNSTLLRLFLICLGVPLTRASSSKLKPKASALILSDTTNSAPAVQLKEQDILVESVPEENLLPEMDALTLEKLKGFVGKRQYDEVAKLADGMDKDEFLRYLCQVVTTLELIKGLFGYLKQRDVVAGFLAHGEMMLVRKVIVETELLETDNIGGCDSIYDAIALSLDADYYERVAGLFEAAKERPTWKNKFNIFVAWFFARYSPEEDSMPLKRFLTLYGEELGKQHPATFGVICERLVGRLECHLDNPVSQKLLIDFVGQPSLLTPVACAWGFLFIANDISRANFTKYGYKEAIEEGLREKYCKRGRGLWRVMVEQFPKQFSGKYPNTDEARTAALKDLPTKQDREEAWARENAPILLKHLETLATELPLPRVLLPIVTGYAITWVVV